MCNVQKHISEAYQYLRMTAVVLYQHTPSEYLNMRVGAIEGIYDEMERDAGLAIMIGNAVNARKKIKSSDLFKRPSNEVKSDKTADDVRTRQKAIKERLEQFEEFRGKFDYGV